MRRSTTALAALCATFMAQSATAETASVPAAKMFPFLEVYYGLSPAKRDHFQMAYFFNFKDTTRDKVSLILKGQNGDTALTIGANNRVTPLPTQADLKLKRDIALTVPKGGKVGIDIKLIPTVTPAAVMSAGPLATSVTQAREGAKKAAGLLSLAVPDYKAVCFEGVRTGRVSLKSGQAAPLKVQGSRPCFVPSDIPDAATLTLDATPSAMYIEPKPK